MTPCRWFRFTIREMFLTIAAAGLGLGWYFDHERVRGLHEAMDFIELVDRISKPDDTMGACRTVLFHRNRTYFVQVFRGSPAGEKEFLETGKPLSGD